VYAVAKAALKRSEAYFTPVRYSNLTLWIASFISDFDLKKIIPLHPTDNRYKTIFPYIVYPSKFAAFKYNNVLMPMLIGMPRTPAI
jgi:hypothetical protein